MKRAIIFAFSLVIFTFLLSPLLYGEDMNDLAYQNRFLLKAGTILNSEGKGDCLIFPYYDVRAVDGKSQITEISIENFGEYGIVAKLRFREWSRGKEVFSKNIWIPSCGTWNGKIEINEKGTNATISSFDPMVWRYDANHFYLSNLLLEGSSFSNWLIRKHPTLYGFIEVIGEEKTSPSNLDGKVGRLSKTERDCPNHLMGKAYIKRPEDDAVMVYDAVAIGNFSRGQGSLFRSTKSPYPRLDNCEDTLDQLEFQLSKWEIFGPYSLNPSSQAKTSMIITYPTKFFHYPYGSRTNQVNNPFEARMVTGKEVLETTLSEQGQPFVNSPVGLPYSVNVIGFYKDYIEKPFGIDNVAMQTFASEFGEATLKSNSLSERVLIADYEYYEEGRFMRYGGLPAVGLILQESRNSPLNATLTPVEYSTNWIQSSAETISTPATPSGPTSGVVGTSYTFMAGGSSSNLGHSIQYFFDWGDGTNSDWLPAGTISASKTWTAGGTFAVYVRARCAEDTSVVSNWSNPLVMTIEQISPPTILTGPTTGLPNTPYTYSTGGAFSNLGHPVQYLFDWGDNTDSGWLSMGVTSATKSWSVGGTYSVSVKARCSIDPLVESGPGPTLAVILESISTPNAPVGPDKGVPGDTFTYMTGGAASNIGHPIEYFFDWDDGTNSSWQSGTSASKTWTKGGAFSVKVRARCATDTSIMSDWSSALTVNIEKITVSTPTGPTTGVPNTPYTYSASGSSNTGDPVQIGFFFSDGGSSGWLSTTGGTASISKSWTSIGTFTVTAKARCAIHTSNESDLSSALSVKIELTITNPSTPTGNVPVGGGTIDENYNFSTGGSTCSNGGSVQYQFDWGDGSDFSTWGSGTQVHSWTGAGTYSVRAKARCAGFPSVESAWSNGLSVTINP